MLSDMMLSNTYTDTHEPKFIRDYLKVLSRRKEQMPSRQQKSAKKGSERYLMTGPNHILVTLRWDDRRYPGHEHVRRWFLSRYK